MLRRFAERLAHFQTSIYEDDRFYIAAGDGGMHPEPERVPLRFASKAQRMSDSQPGSVVEVSESSGVYDVIASEVMYLAMMHEG